MTNQLKTITKQQLLTLGGLSSKELLEIIEDPMETRVLLDSINSEELYGDRKKYVLFDNNVEELSLRVIQEDVLDKYLIEVLGEHDEELLRMVAMDEKHNDTHRDFFSPEYYERFVSFVQATILEGPATNWYIEMSDYARDFLFDWFGTKAIIEYNKEIKTDKDFFDAMKKVEASFGLFAKKAKEIASGQEEYTTYCVLCFSEKVDGSEGKCILLNGTRIVNRIDYCITENPWRSDPKGDDYIEVTWEV